MIHKNCFKHFQTDNYNNYIFYHSYVIGDCSISMTNSVVSTQNFTTSPSLVCSSITVNNITCKQNLIGYYIFFLSYFSKIYLFITCTYRNTHAHDRDENANTIP